MSRGRFLTVAAALAVWCGSHAAFAQGVFTLSSPDFRDGERLPLKNAGNNKANPNCVGENVSPALNWANPPAGTKSFAITMYDPDAPTGSGWWHWLVFNIPASTTELPAGAGDPSKQLAPAGSVQSRTDFGQPGYGGPCPPKGDIDHHYHFTVYALDVEKLEGPTEKTTGALLVFMMRGHVLATGKIIGTFSH